MSKYILAIITSLALVLLIGISSCALAIGVSQIGVSPYYTVLAVMCWGTLLITAKGLLSQLLKIHKSW